MKLEGLKVVDLSWFLPGNYSLMSMPAGWTADNFVPLA